MEKLEIKFSENSDYVDCPDLGDRVKIVNCYRCKYFENEELEKKENKVYKEIINCKFEIEKEENKNAEDKG